ncbi:hypothetical protein K2173_025420 [Erythroxylum novogranatense]|uniref:Uncharacterized protein n=1 Tax=Erythroxylum novogranatense TaxID=1862640 RepID=A0AAV8UGI3_9ROSI|nr:hypothetical protein K2173_025420 [Erythroxylum novogranatense]
MRIRKSGKFSALLFFQESGVEPVQAYSCQLNQSPWDVLPFPSQEFNEEDAFKEDESVQVALHTAPRVFEAVQQYVFEINMIVISCFFERERLWSTVKGPRSCRRKRTIKKNEHENNDDGEFYYYSGFGPKWLGKRKAADNAEENNNGGKVCKSTEDDEKLIESKDDKNVEGSASAVVASSSKDVASSLMKN